MTTGEATVETSASTKVQAARFAGVGVLNTFIDFSLFNLLHFVLGLAIPVANVISVSAAIINSFALNKLWTFHNRRAQGVLGQIGLFVMVSLVGLMVNTGVVHLLTETWRAPGVLASSLLQSLGLSAASSGFMVVNMAKACAVAATMTWNFVGYKLLVFRR